MAEPEHVLESEYLPLSVGRDGSDSGSLKSHQDSKKWVQKLNS